VYRGGPPIRVGAFPVSFGNPFLWSGWAERPDAALEFNLNLRSDFDPTAPYQIFYKPDPSPALEAARRALPVEKFLAFAPFPIWHVLPVAEPEGAQLVTVRDWRFPFTASATVDRSNKVISSSFRY